MKAGFRTLRGFSLVEVVLALGVASFCLVVLVALVPVGLQRYQKADSQSSMVNLATMVASDLDATTNGTSAVASPRFSFSIPASGGNASGNTPQTVYVDASGVATGTLGLPPTSASIYRISLFFYPPASPLKVATTARILITAPALADPSPQSAPAKYSNIFETSISLNRN
jgi:Tfp pilus assembly protein PilW